MKLSPSSEEIMEAVPRRTWRPVEAEIGRAVVARDLRAWSRLVPGRAEEEEPGRRMPERGRPDWVTGL